MKLTEAVKKIYEEQDKSLTKILSDLSFLNLGKDKKVTCNKSCSHCCYLLATISFADGILLAEYIFDKEDWKSWIGILAKHASSCCYEGITQPNYFEKHIPCVFLNTETKLCKVYDIRPAACRYHYSIDDPQKCSIESPRDVRFVLLNLVQFEEPIWKLSMMATKGIPIGGPISLVVLFCMEMISREETEINSTIKETISKFNLIDPIKWMKTCGMSTTSDLINNSPDQFEDGIESAKRMKEFWEKRNG